MAIEEIRSKIRNSVLEGAVASGVDLSTLPGEQRTKLVDAITDRVLISVNDMLDDFPGIPAKGDVNTGNEEQVLWQGRPFLSLNEAYVITNERIKLIKGLIGRDIENFELIRVQDIDVSQSPGERILNLGDIRVIGADRSNPTVILRNIKDPQEVYELLRKAWLNARKKYGLLFREEM